MEFAFEMASEIRDWTDDERPEAAGERALARIERAGAVIGAGGSETAGAAGCPVAVTSFVRGDVGSTGS